MKFTNEYIEKQTAIDVLHEAYEARNPTQNAIMDKATMVIFRLPPADVRPVVRCKDCKHWEYDVIFRDGWCRGKRQGNPEWYCADWDSRTVKDEKNGQ